MLAKFYEALIDEPARWTVEFNKEPKRIDDAVDLVIQYIETCRKPQFEDRR